MLQPYRDWAPTPFDPRGKLIKIGADYHDLGDWLVCPVIQTRDSGDLENSNFEGFQSAIAETGPEFDGETGDWYAPGFGHWGPGYFSILLVRPGTQAETIARELSDRLEDYPVLDEDDWGRREFVTACETWENMIMRDRIRPLAKHGCSIFAARRNDLPDLSYYDDLTGN